MRELEMNGQMVQLNFGMGFLRRINATTSVPVDGMQGVRENVGLKYSVGKLINNDVETLVDVIDMANAGCEPRVTKTTIDAFIDDENTNMDEVFEKVLGFLKTSNATQNGTMEAIENVEKAKKLNEAKLKMQMEAMA